MIKRIASIKNFGIFKNYRRTGNISDFQHLNIIYGWNYSGKTTISRLLNCFEKEELSESYNHAKFELVDYSDRRFDETNLKMPDTHVRVFNSDFIKNNLGWDGEEFDPILLLGEDSIEAVNKISQLNKRISRSEYQLNRAETTYKSIQESINSALTNQAGIIKTQLAIVSAFTRTHVRPILKLVKDNVENYIINDQAKVKLLIKSATADESDKLPHISGFGFQINLESINEECI